MIRFMTASGEIVSPGGDPNVKKGMVPTPPLKGNAVFSASAMADPRDARIAELEAKVARLEAKLAAANAGTMSTMSSVPGVPVTGTGKRTDRSEYLRQHKADARVAKKLGITVAEYRALSGGKP